MPETSKGAALELVEKFMPDWSKNREDMDRVDRWHRGELDESDKPRLPKKYTAEYKELRDRSMGRWLGLVVTTLAQVLYVEGYRRSDSSVNAPSWKVWQANRFDGRQIPLHRGALSLGSAYVVSVPGVHRLTGEPLPNWSPKSARRMVAFYGDPVEDEWPLYALEAEGVRLASGKVRRVSLWDHEVVHRIDITPDGKLTYVDFEAHDTGVCPVVRYDNVFDLDGRADGEVEPMIDLAGRIDQSVFDRLVVQRFGAWHVRTISGMELPDVTPMEGETQGEAERRALIQMSMLDFLVSEDPDTKFGSLPATPLDGYIRAAEADIRQFASVSQTPPHTMLGDMINLSADALAAAEMGHTRKATERKHTLGESHEQLLRLSSLQMGDLEGAADDAAQVVWADLESRSLAQVADALGKLTQMLGVPAQALWSRIPGVTQTDVEAWRDMADDSDDMLAFVRQIAAQAPSAITDET